MRKHGLMSGQWTLEDEGRVVAEATKPSVLKRAFQVRLGELELRVIAPSMFSRPFKIAFGDAVVGTVGPVHPFTRRAVIECEEDVPELAVVFSFWLVLLLWKRAANSNAGGQ